MIKQRAFAWAKYYESVREHITADTLNYQVITRNTGDPSIPEHIKAEFKAMGDALKKTWECPICIEMISPDNLGITNCGHFYCNTCLTAWKGQAIGRGETKVDCAICRRQIRCRGEE